jgi:hypothetical protein
VQDGRSTRLSDWQEGVDHFNSLRFWDAHEAWERGWLKLPPKEKTHIQICIQGAGVFYLIEKGRLRGAHSLAQAALGKMAWIREQGGIDSTFPRVEIPGLKEALENFVQRQILAPKNRLHARLLLSPT